jgi:hypothetical protein
VDARLTEHVMIRLTPEQREWAEEQARDRETKVATYVRWLVELERRRQQQATPMPQNAARSA